MAELDVPLLHLAGRRGGVLSRDDLKDLGVTRRRLERLVASGLLRRATPAVFLVAGWPISWEQRVRIALAQAGPTAVASHATAGVLWGLPGLGRGGIEVVVPRGVVPPRRTVGRVHRSRRRREEAHVRLAGGLPVTPPGETLLDLAARLRASHLFDCLLDLCQRGLVTVPELVADVERWRGRGVVGGGRLPSLLEGVGDVPELESFLEAKFLRLVMEHRLPRPRTQVVVEAECHRYRVDALWDRWRLIVELNGYGTHAGRVALSADAERSARLQGAGYDLVTFTYDQVIDRPRYVVAQLGRRLAPPPGGGRALPSPSPSVLGPMSTAVEATGLGSHSAPQGCGARPGSKAGPATLAGPEGWVALDPVVVRSATPSGGVATRFRWVAQDPGGPRGWVGEAVGHLGGGRRERTGAAVASTPCRRTGPQRSGNSGRAGGSPCP